MNINESSKALKKGILKLQEICQNEGFTIESNYKGDIELVLHYKADNDNITTCRSTLETTPF